MTAVQLLNDLRREGFVLAFNAGKINVRPKELITDEIRGQIAAVRPELLQILYDEQAQLVPAAEFVAELQAEGAILPNASTSQNITPEPIPTPAPGETIAVERLVEAGWKHGDAVRIFRALELARDIPVGFEFRPHHYVHEPVAWRQMLAHDALCGPTGPRSRNGALIKDLRGIIEARGSPASAAS